MNITINNTIIDEAVKRQLAVIGKRATSEDGKRAFAEITLSSIETPVLHDFYADAVLYLNTETQYHVNASTTPSGDGVGSAEGTVILEFPSNHKTAMDATIRAAFLSFLVAYAIYAWVSITSPRLAERYLSAMRDKLNSIIQLIWFKAPPQVSYDTMVQATVNIPGDITMSDGEQRLFSYVLGSDGLDDLTITSTNAEILVSKNSTTKVFSILVRRNSGATTNTTGTITVSRSNTNTTLATFTVTALPASGINTSEPILIGYGYLTDHITMHPHQTIVINFTGTITSMETTNGDVASASDNGPSAIFIDSNYAGSCVITLYGNNGWQYKLYVDVIEVQSTSPTIDAVSPFPVKEGQTRQIPYTLGSDNIDDFVIEKSNNNINVSKDGTNRKFIIEGVTAGYSNVNITSNAHPEANKGLLVPVTSAIEDIQPEVYDYSNGQMIELDSGTSIEISFYPGSRGTMVVTCPDGTATVTYTGNKATIKPTVAGTSRILFENVAMDFSFALYVKEDEVEPAADPYLSYMYGTPSPTNKPRILYDNSINLTTNDDIYVTVGGMTNESLLNVTTSNPSNVSVTRTASGQYTIHPITGSANITFRYGSWVKTFNVTYEVPEVVNPDEPEEPETEEAPISAVMYLIGESSPENKPKVIEGDAINLATDKDISVWIVGEYEEVFITYESTDDEKLSVERVADGQYLIHPISGTAGIQFGYAGTYWSKRINVTYTASQPTIEDGNFSRGVEESDDYTDTIKVINGTVTGVDCVNHYIRVKRNGNTIQVGGVTAGNDVLTIMLQGGGTLTVYYTINEAAGPGGDPGGNNEPDPEPEYVTTGSHRTLTYGETETIYVNGTITQDGSSNAQVLCSITDSYGKNNVEVEALSVGTTEFTIMLSDDTIIIVYYEVVAKSVSPTPTISELSHNITVEETQSITVTGGRAEGYWTTGNKVLVSWSGNTLMVTGRATGTSTVHVITNAGTVFDVVYTVRAAGTPPWIDGTDHLREDTRAIVSDQTDTFVIRNGYVNGVESSNPNIGVGYTSGTSEEVTVNPAGNTGAADITVHTREGYDIVVHYTITQAPTRPTASITSSDGGTVNNNNYSVSLQVGQTATVTIQNGTLTSVSQAYVGGGGNQNLFEITTNGNVATVKAIAEGTNILFFNTTEATNGNGSHSLIRTFYVSGPSAPDGIYRNLCEGDTDTITIPGAKITSFQSSNTNALTVQKTSDDTLAITSVSGSQAGTSVAMTMVCNNWPANTFTVNYKIWPAAQAVTLPNDVTRVSPRSTISEFVNKSNSEHLDSVYLVLCAGVPMTSNITYTQERPLIQLSWDETLGSYVIKNVTKYDTQIQEYCYYTNGQGYDTLAVESAETNQKVYEVACMALQHYGFTGDNVPVLGSTIHFASSRETPWEFELRNIIIPE